MAQLFRVEETTMPRYEFICEKCHEPFELIMTIAEREKGQEGRAATRGFHGADVEEELSGG